MKRLPNYQWLIEFFFFLVKVVLLIKFHTIWIINALVFFPGVLIIKKNEKKTFFSWNLYKRKLSFNFLPFNKARRKYPYNTFQFSSCPRWIQDPGNPEIPFKLHQGFQMEKKKKKSVAYCRAISLIYALDIRLPNMAHHFSLVFDTSLHFANFFVLFKARFCTLLLEMIPEDPH